MATVGGRALLRELALGAGAADLRGALAELSEDPDVDGVVLQYPAPAGVDLDDCAAAIAPGKDVDGMTAPSRRRLEGGDLRGAPATVRGLVGFLEAEGITVPTDPLLVGGAGALVRGLEGWLRGTGRAPRRAAPRTKDLEEQVRGSAFVIAAAQRPGCVAGAWLADHAVALDLGYLDPGGGDLALGDDAGRLAAYLPARGNAGPWTVAELVSATVARWAERAAMSW